MFSGLDTVDLPHGRRWTALTSFILQGILVSAALVLPLLHPADLPEAFMRHRIFVPMRLGDIRSQPSPNISPRGGGVRLQAIIVRNPFTFPSGHNHAATVADRIGPPDPQIGSGPDTGDRLGSLFTDGGARPVYHPAPVAKPRPISVVMEGNLIHRVEPLYPVIAKQIRLQGVVELRALVSSDGTIHQVQVVSGPAILAHAAIEAVNQWKYRPYYLNGVPISVETEITVKFTLN
jgi:periplasmic protein TonB